MGLPARSDRAQQCRHRHRDVQLQPSGCGGGGPRTTDRRQGGQAVGTMQRAIRWRTALLAATIIGASAAAVAGCVSTVAGLPRVGGDRAPLSWGPDLAAAQLADVLLDAA